MSDAGSPWASVPPSVPRLRTCWSAIVRGGVRRQAQAGRSRPRGASSSRRSARARCARDAAQARDPPQVDEQRRRREPQLHQRQQRVPAGQELRVLAAVGRAPSASSSVSGAT